MCAYPHVTQQFPACFLPGFGLRPLIFRLCASEFYGSANLIVPIFIRLVRLLLLTVLNVSSWDLSIVPVSNHISLQGC